MNKYLARAWVEISLGLLEYRMSAGEQSRPSCADVLEAAGWTPMDSTLFVRGQTLGEILDGAMQLTRIPEREFPHVRRADDSPSTVSK